MKISTIVIVLLLSACSSKKLIRQENTAIVVMSAAASGWGISGVGCGFKLKNIETHIEYESTSFNPFISYHSAVPNIPLGTYLVSELRIELGSVYVLNRTPEMTAFFDTLRIEEHKKYYIGDYQGVMKVGRKDHVFLYLSDRRPPINITKKLAKDRYGWPEENFVLIAPNRSDTLTLH